VTVPTYEYVCAGCKHAFEEFQSMSEAPLRKCPKCGKRKLRRLFGIGAGIIFKGSGFYETDYKRKTGGEEAKRDAAAAKESAGGAAGDSKAAGDAKADAPATPAAKPAAKPDAKAPESAPGKARSDAAKPSGARSPSAPRSKGGKGKR
jgi:putative FmdB family regulatory protein